MKSLAKMMVWGFFTGLLISIFMAFFYDFFDIFPSNPHSPNAIDRDWYIIFFLWPSCILWIGNLVTGIDLLIFVMVISLINAIRYSVVFLLIGVLCNLSSTSLKDDICKISSLIHFRKRSIKALGELSLHLFFVGIAAGVFLLISGYILNIILPTLHKTIEQWGIVMIALFFSHLDELFWNNLDVALNASKLIFINGAAYSFAALFIGTLCNIFVLGRTKLA